VIDHVGYAFGEAVVANDTSRPLQWGKNGGAATTRIRSSLPRLRPLPFEECRMIANHFSCTKRVAHHPHPGEDGTVFAYPKAPASDSA